MIKVCITLTIYTQIRKGKNNPIFACKAVIEFRTELLEKLILLFFETSNIIVLSMGGH